MTAVSPGSADTSNSGEPPRLPLRWAVIIGVTIVAGIASFAAGGTSVAVVSATAVALALHQLIA